MTYQVLTVSRVSTMRSRDCNLDDPVLFLVASNAPLLKAFIPVAMGTLIDTDQLRALHQQRVRSQEQLAPISKETQSPGRLRS